MHTSGYGFCSPSFALGGAWLDGTPRAWDRAGVFVSVSSVLVRTRLEYSTVPFRQAQGAQEMADGYPGVWISKPSELMGKMGRVRKQRGLIEGNDVDGWMEPHVKGLPMRDEA